MTRRHQAFKTTVNRKEIIKSAQSIFNDAGNDHIEIDFLGEPGIGQGPTLEFFNLLSQEIQTLNVWIRTGSGLFPHPEVEDFRWFLFAGQFVGKVVLDKRIADLPISPVFIKQVFGQPVTLKDLEEVDRELFQSLQCIAKLPPESINSLELSFVLPGFQKELVPQGAGISVTEDNFFSYYSRVIRMYLLNPNAADAFRQGLEQFIPVKDLSMFDPEEFQVLLCGENSAPWPVEMLSQALLPTHGFTQDSKTFKNLLQVLSEFRKSEQEKFVKFVTGSPKLPSGGLLGLSPKMTVVRKEDSGDAHLPSVMTCVNYLKIPDYSSCEILKKNLIYAMEECPCTFYLS
jgi:E3 ubiquitin-protein ligase TRIP12